MKPNNKEKKRREFQPWVDQEKKGRIFLFSCIGLFAASIISTILGFPGFGGIVAVIGIFFLSKSTYYYENARVREFGKTFENEHIGLACDYLSNNEIECHPNVMINGIGDIDLLVKSNGKLIPVEVKSFRYWSSSLFSMGQREKSAIAQAKRQIRALHDSGHRIKRGIIWLPQGTPNFLQRFFGVRYGAVMLVFGNKKQLFKTIKKL